MKARTRRRTASSRGSNQSPPAKGDGDVAAADVASVMAWVPSRSCRSEPTPPQLFPTNLAPRPDARSRGHRGKGARERDRRGLHRRDPLRTLPGGRVDARWSTPRPPRGRRAIGRRAPTGGRTGIDPGSRPSPAHARRHGRSARAAARGRANPRGTLPCSAVALVGGMAERRSGCGARLRGAVRGAAADDDGRSALAARLASAFSSEAADGEMLGPQSAAAIGRLYKLLSAAPIEPASEDAGFGARSGTPQGARETLLRWLMQGTDPDALMSAVNTLGRERPA